MKPPTQEDLEALQQYNTCNVANAIETLGLRLRNEGYTRPGLTCPVGSIRPVVGYAVTSRVRSSDPPLTGYRYDDRSDWWELMGKLPHPQIAVIRDDDPRPRTGSVLGEIHAAVLKALRCSGIVTDGAVRDLDAIRRLGIPVLSNGVVVSHAYNHMIGFGEPVEIEGLTIHPGDLLMMDEHGVVSIPLEVASEIPGIAESQVKHERRVLAICSSRDFSLAALREEIRKSAR
ncbi:MAG: RraA family protein [Thermoanaerobaculia bacterium]